MTRIRVCDDLDECRRIWEWFWPAERVFDLWPVRECFARHYGHRPHFLLAERDGTVEGVLPLAWIGDAGYYGYFPGETCHARTWLEENRIPASSPGVLHALVEALPGPAQVRYLLREDLPDNADFGLDEIGYLFLPGEHGYSFDSYRGLFSGKSRKRLDRELAGLEAHGLSVRLDQLADVDALFRMNLEAFGEQSFFADPRFLRSFEDLAAWLYDRKLLRVTTVCLGGEIAAIDIGASWRRTHVVMAGGTRPEFPGVAKLINFQHLRWACEARLDRIDFLCGDFGWKERFHLTPRPLYMLVERRNPQRRDDGLAARDLVDGA